MHHNELIKRTLITDGDVKARIAELGRAISDDYRGSRPLLIGVLKGAWIYLSDLLREIDFDCEVDFMSVSSYGSGTDSSGSITIVKDLTVDVTDRDVIIVEDIIDSGLTLSHLKGLLESRNARSVEITTLLSKPSRRRIDVPVRYIGFEIEDEFVVGYGLDFDERFRGLKDICVLKEEAYK
jgi:hypoxanthine phosphoribosyltransferase